MSASQSPAQSEAARTFEALVADEWAWRLEQFPRLASLAGDHRYDDRLERVDAASRQARIMPCAIARRPTRCLPRRRH